MVLPLWLCLFLLELDLLELPVVLEVLVGVVPDAVVDEFEAPVVEPDVEVLLPVEVEDVDPEAVVPELVVDDPVEVDPPPVVGGVTTGVARVKLPPVVAPFQIFELGLVLGVAIIEVLAKLMLVEPEPVKALKLTVPTNSLSVGAVLPPGT
jgi:hypothetical protein